MKFSVHSGLFWLFSITAVLFASDLRAGVDASALPARRSPDWLRAATVYEIFPRQFSPGSHRR